jgi:thiamine-phosphate pyrophosphorylase
VTLIQYRNKGGSARETLAQARELQRVVANATAGADAERGAPVTHAEDVRLIMNDRADLCLAADFDGVHVGQEDLSPMSVRAIVGAHRWVGVSTHNPAQVREADTWPVDSSQWGRFSLPPAN